MSIFELFERKLESGIKTKTFEQNVYDKNHN